MSTSEKLCEELLLLLQSGKEISLSELINHLQGCAKCRSRIPMVVQTIKDSLGEGEAFLDRLVN